MYSGMAVPRFLGAVVLCISFVGPKVFADTVTLTRTGLTGVASEGGVVGGGPGQVDEFDVGRYIITSDNLVLRARAEIDNSRPEGSPAGNEGILYVERDDKGIGAGSLLSDGPGSKEISGGGPHGSEIVSFLFSGDPLLVTPQPAIAGSVVVQVNKFKSSKDDLSVILFEAGGGEHLFGPSVVEPLLSPTADSGRFDLSFASLPGIGSIGDLASFDVRSGVLKTDGKLSGGHFYVSSLGYTPVPEPVSLVLLAFGGAALCGRRSKAARF